MQGLKNILSKYYGALICTALTLCPFLAKPAFAQSPFNDFANWFVNEASNNIQNKIRTIRDIASNAQEFAISAANTIISAADAVYNAIVDILVGTCPQAAVFYQNHLGGCWSCTFFDTVFTTLNSLATETYYRIAPSCAVLMMICAMIWIGVFTIRYIGALHGQDPAEYLTKLFGLLLKCMAVGVLLVVSASTFAHLILSPIIVASSDLSTAILQSFTEIKEQVVDGTAEATTTASCDSEKGCTVKPIECSQDGNCKITEGDSVRFTPLACEKMKEEPKMGGLLYDGDPIPENEKLLNDQIYYSLMCMVNNLHYEIAYVVALADAMICYSWTANTVWILPSKYLSLKMLISGLFIFVTAIIISIFYVFKLIDALFRLSILCVLLPLLAVAWVFPATVEFAKKGFGMLVHVMMMFITLAIVVSLVLMLVLVAFTSDSGDTSLMQLFNENRIYDMKDLLDFFSLNFLFGLISLFLAFKLLDVIDHVASAFSGVDVGTSVGDKLSVTLARCTSYITKSASTVAKLGVTTAGHHIGARIARSDFGSRFHAATRNFNFKLQQALGVAPSAAAMKSTARMTAIDFEAAKLAGTAGLGVLRDNIKYAEEIKKLEAELAKDPTSKHLQAGVKYHKKAYPEAAKLAADDTKFAEAKRISARAEALEMVYGRTKLNSLANEQKEQLMLDRKVEDKDKMEKAVANYTDLKDLDAGEFKDLKDKADLAEKIREGTASDDEMDRASIMLSAGDKDMQNLMVMQEEDFDEQKKLIKDTEDTAKDAKTEVQKEFKDIADEQGNILKGVELGYRDDTLINDFKDAREKITDIANSLKAKGWDVGEDTFVKNLETTYVDSGRISRDVFDDVIWK